MRIRQPRGNAALGAIVLEGLLSRMSFGLISFALPLYARHLGLSLSEVGILIALNSAVAVMLKPALGWAADRYGRKPVYLASIGVRSLVALALGVATAPWQLFAIRSMHGLSMALRDPSATALIADSSGEKSVASGFAWYQTAKTVAAATSKTLAGVLLVVTATNYSLVFFVAFALSLLPLWHVARLVREDGSATRMGGSPASPVPLEPSQAIEPPATPPQPRPKIWPFAGLGFLFASTAEMLHGLFPILATEYAGLTQAQAGVVYTVSTLAIIVSGPVFGWLSDNVSRKLVMMVRGIANTFSSVLYLIAPTFVGVVTARTMDDIGKAAFRPAWGALMAHISSFDKRNRARTMSWMSMGEDAAGVVAPVLAGFLWHTWGITALMGSRILLALVTELYAVFVARLPRSRPQVPDRPAGERAVSALPQGGTSPPVTMRRPEFITTAEHGEES
jgi:MFS family permease